MIDFSTMKRTALTVPLLAFVAAATSACHVVVPNLGSETVFGYTTSGELDPKDVYAVGTKTCTAELYPNAIFPVEVDTPTTAYLNTLRSAFPAWTFNTASSDLSDKSIEIRTYDVQGTAARVGVEIHAHYARHSGDPSSNLHWIQVLTTNHGLRGTGHGPIATYTDVANNATATDPYYDTGYAANASDIYDFPGRGDTSQDHTWEATTFLVTGPASGSASGTVTIRVPGFNWGWKNTCTESADGARQFHYVFEEPERFVLPGPLEPGGKLELRSTAPVHATLRKDAARAPVRILSERIAFDIDKRVDGGRASALKNARGTITFGSYAFNGKQMPAAIADIGRGAGFIQWESGEASLQFVAALRLPDGTTQYMQFNGTGQYDKEAKSFIVNAGMVGIGEAYLRRSAERVNKDSTNKE